MHLNINIEKDAFIIFSASRSDKNEFENMWRSHAAATALDALNIPFERMEGVYKGTPEASFLIGPEHRQAAIHLAALFGQESILVKYSERREEGPNQVLLVRPSTELDILAALGTWSKVTKEEAEKLDNYSMIAGNYYTTKL